MRSTRNIENLPAAARTTHSVQTFAPEQQPQGPDRAARVSPHSRRDNAILNPRRARRLLKRINSRAQVRSIYPTTIAMHRDHARARLQLLRQNVLDSSNQRLFGAHAVPPHRMRAAKPSAHHQRCTSVAREHQGRHLVSRTPGTITDAASLVGTIMSLPCRSAKISR